jgi:hypothetical protein
LNLIIKKETIILKDRKPYHRAKYAMISLTTDPELIMDILSK